jgi:hypothetical protein
MIDIETLALFFGWCTVINMGVLIFATILLFMTKGVIADLHSKLTGVAKKSLSDHYFSYLANYKIAIFMLNLVPYVALKLMA